MKQEIIFISDLHISLEKKEITHRFLSFLETRAPQASALYILGDLFDSWVGDDDNMPPNKSVKQALRRLTASTTHVFLQQGNRDFLLGHRFAEETGVVLLGDYEVIDLFGTQTLLTHGDLLCSDDIAYQQFRAKSHSEEWKKNVLSKPLLVRLLVARWYRFRSHFHKRNKSQDIMDVNQQTVAEMMKQYGCFRLIHGHTHRPAIHDFEINGISAERFVLADWKNSWAEILCWNETGFRIEKLH